MMFDFTRVILICDWYELNLNGQTVLDCFRFRRNTVANTVLNVILPHRCYTPLLISAYDGNIRTGLNLSNIGLIKGVIGAATDTGTSMTFIVP